MDSPKWGANPQSNIYGEKMRAEIRDAVEEEEEFWKAVERRLDESKDEEEKTLIQEAARQKGAYLMITAPIRKE